MEEPTPEIWKPTSYTDAYEISSHGELRFAKTKSIRKLSVKEGKLYASLVANGKDVKCNIARQVLTAFVRHPQLSDHARHKNGVRTDNRVENLEWRSGSTNDTHVVSAKSIPVEVTGCGAPMRFDSSKEAAAYLGKSRDTIYRNDGKQDALGLTTTKISDGPGADAVIKEIKFGDKVVKVSSDGWVKPGDGRWKKVTTERGGYFRTSFQFDKDGNTKRNRDGKVLSQYFEMHRLVCEAFHGPPPEKADAHHINEVKTDNRPENLEWRSRSSNMKVSYELGFNVSANEILTYQYHIGGEFTGNVYKSASEAARSVEGCHVGSISSCCSGTNLSHKTFEWSYKAPEEYATQRDVMQARAKEHKKEIGRKRREKQGPPKSTAKPIFGYDATTLELRGSYPSGKAAAEDTKCNKANISNCVNGKLKQTGGYIFSRKDPETFRAERNEEVDG